MSIFEVDSSVAVPRDKTELQELLRTNKAIPFHKRVCASCHGVPKSKEWMAANETDGKSKIVLNFDLLTVKVFLLDLGIFYIGKRTGYFVHWEVSYWNFYIIFEVLKSLNLFSQFTLERIVIRTMTND